MPRLSALHEVLLATLDEAYRGPSWHGPNLTSAIRSVSPALASWRPTPNRRSIAEQALHAAYWKYVIRRKLTGLKRRSFSLKGSNWFLVEAPLALDQWKAHRALLDAEHQLLCEAVAVLPVKRLSEPVGRDKLTHAQLIRGGAMHDIYHAGQIQLLKKLADDRQFRS